MATVTGMLKQELRQARAALVTDTTDMTFDATPTREEFPGQRNTDVAGDVSLRL
jgi:hypothetical protein